MRPISWLHVSDIHMRMRDAWSQDVVLTAMCGRIEKLREDGLAPDFILATGDLAFSGKPEEYALARDFFEALSKASGVPKERIFSVPGNHDIDRSRQTLCFKGARSTLDSQQLVDEVLAPCDDLATLLEREQGYRRFQNEYFDNQKRTSTPDGLAYVSRLVIDDIYIAILGLDSAWIAEGGLSDHGNLLIGERQVINALTLAQNPEEPPHIVISMAHHPCHLLCEFDRVVVQGRIERGSQFFHCGHLHLPEARVVGQGATGCLMLAAGASFETRESQNTFSVIEMDLLGARRRVTTIHYDPRHGEFSSESHDVFAIEVAAKNRVFGTIGASGKRTQEALSAGCVGTFGIGGFANFGVCEALEVTSQADGAAEGTLTRLSEKDIDNAGGAIPDVTMQNSNDAAPRGTLVAGYLRETPNVDQLRNYLRDFVRYVPTAIYFNGEKISQRNLSDLEDRENLTEISGRSQEWQSGDLTITGRLYEDRGHALTASIEGLSVDGEAVNLVGHLRFENGPIDVFKRGFKLCATQVGSTIGVSGRLDCDRFIPTAGRDSLDGDTISLLGRITQAMERIAVEAVLESPERIAQHTRVFRYVVRQGLIDRVSHVKVNLADGTEALLGTIRKRAEQGGVGVFFGTAQKQALNQIMQARGHIVVLLSADRFRRDAETRYLQQYCAAKPFDGMIDCAERYEELRRFERVFLSELELSISKSYEVANFRLIPGRLTEDIPVFVKEHGGSQSIDIFADVRHQEIAKLEDLGFTQLLYSLIGTFCREYLGPSLKKYSPRFFGDGALNLEMLAKRRSELWILLKDDIGVVRKGGKKQVVTRSDVHVVNVGGGQPQPAQDHPPGKPPRIIHVIDDQGTTNLGGYYIRLPDTAFRAYGDLLPECDSRGVVWAGNKIMYVASDAVSAAFQYEIRVDEVVAATVNGQARAAGAIQLEKPLQEMYEGIYFSVPQPLEQFLVPTGDEEIRLELHCDWIDMRTAKHWTPRESASPGD